MEYLIQTHGVCKNYGKAKILKNVDIHVPKGSVYGFVGRNGAGKTTLIRVLSGLNLPTSGNYTINGVDYKDKAMCDVRSRIGAVVETPSIYPDLSAAENMKMMCRLLGKPADNIDNVLRMVELSNTGKKKAGDFSLGMRQRLGIAFSLINDPELLILDEPINGLDPQGIMEMRELLMKLNTEKGITIFISSHILDELSKLATHYGFIDKGVVLKEMSAEELHDTTKRGASLKIDNIEAFKNVMAEHNLEYKILSADEAVIYSDFTVTPLVIALSHANCNVISMTEKAGSLEDYFISLIGGGSID